ncbi:protein kintoun [Anthonomus grandis grandis]|uniref:protein kintoun n=1 Tax=Anthonomus grandis grandis TaxID=2921223 RepID=UPI002164FDC5|nr:protein kintoun [Anthonomus grandis grandis]
MESSSFDRLKELNLSRDEVNRIGEALKKEEFRKLLVDYVEEIQNPENRKKYEEEVAQIERERGQEVTFLHPNAGYVIKTSLNGTQKCFINICSNDNIKKPSSSPSVKDGARGLQWSVPHSLSPPHEDIDNKGVRCQVFDVLFHPDTLHLASNNKDFRGMVNNVALEALESNFHVSLDKKNLKFPKISYKGMKRATIMRKPSKQRPSEKTPEEQEMFDKIFAEIDSHRSPKKGSSVKKSKPKRTSSDESKCSYTTPKYSIKHRSHIEMQEFTEDRLCKLNSAIPKELIVEIDLPLLKCSSDMDLDVTEKTVQLISEKPAKYKLNLTLPYQVIESNGTAKFDKDLKKLIITLPVNRKTVYEPVKYDSGVESCLESDLNSPTSPESDDEDSEPNEIVIKTTTEPTAQNSDNFLNASDMYNLPEFTCNTFDNVLAFTLNVKNVDDSTVSKEVNNSLVKVKFTSISSSFYLSCYAFYIKFPQHEVKKEDVTVETWDNNVILQVPLKNSEVPLSSYFYGMNLDTLEEKFIEEPSILNKLLQEPDPQLEVIKEDSELKVKDPVVEEFKEKNQPRGFSERKSKAIDIQAISYESSGDELSFSPRKGKGILKRMCSSRAKFGRSVSESSLDDFLCSSFENYHGSIECVPEDSREDDEEMSSSLKKTVRFNDVVTKQLFRSNSSILGQKKKNQRKARNKKRALERRFSESEASDNESKKEGDTQTVDSNPKNGVVLVTDDNHKKDDHDIFHLEMNN